MKHVTILVPEASVLQAIADPQYLFSAVNGFLQSSGQKPVFEICLAGAKKEIRLQNGQYSVHVDKLFHEVKKTDLIIIPAIFGDIKAVVAKNGELTEWIRDQYEKGAELASLCVGAFLMASTGLLTGKKCSTHWSFANQFREMFPDVELVEGCIITEEKRIYSSGGAHSYWNLLLYLVEKYTNREMAVLASKYFAIDMGRESQSPFAIFRGQKEHDDIEIKKAQAYIEAHTDARINIDELAKKMALGRRTFERRFRQATHNSVLEYMQRAKIEAAKRLFETSRMSIQQVMYEVGYTDTKAFRDLFKKITGLTPLLYRNIYHKMAVLK